MTPFPPSRIIEDEAGRFDHNERVGMRQLGFKIENTTQDPIVEAMREIHDLSALIAKMDCIKSPRIVEHLQQRRLELMTKIPEIGF